VISTATRRANYLLQLKTGERLVHPHDWIRHEIEHGRHRLSQPCQRRMGSNFYQKGASQRTGQDNLDISEQDYPRLLKAFPKKKLWISS